MNKHKIIVKKQHDFYALEFKVTIEEAHGTTTHVIRIEDHFLDLLPKDYSDEEIVIAAFRFLLDREPKEAILSDFDISMIPNYFPNFLSEISSYLNKREN